LAIGIRPESLGAFLAGEARARATQGEAEYDIRAVDRLIALINDLDD
jgi:hypothetical protein